MIDQKKKVSFTINAEPYGKGRPRFRKDGHAYTPKKTKDYEHLVKTEYAIQTGNRQLKGSIRAYITAYFGLNKSDSKKTIVKKLYGDLKPTKKPDCDNIAKTILDALNGIAYDDDSQVVELFIVKKYSENPRVEVTLAEL